MDFASSCIFSGGHVIHSYGRLIPHEFPITNLQQLSGPDRTGRITCTFNSGITYFAANGERIVVGGGVTQIKHGTTATLKVILTSANSFQDRGVYCTNSSNSSSRIFFYLFLSDISEFFLNI